MKTTRTMPLVLLLLVACSTAGAQVAEESDENGELAYELAESARLEQLYETRNAQIAAARMALDQRMGELKEVYSVLQTVVGDTRARFDSSLISLQFPERDTFLRDLENRLASGTDVVSIEDIERLMFELQREISESGKVARFRAVVTDTNGELLEATVVRVGNFNIVSDAGYLQFGDDRTAAVLNRQPGDPYMENAKNLVTATDGTVVFGIDATRGGLLALLVETPSGWGTGLVVAYIALAVGLLGLTILISQSSNLSGKSGSWIPVPAGDASGLPPSPDRPGVREGRPEPYDVKTSSPQAGESSNGPGDRAATATSGRVWIENAPSNRVSLLFATTRKPAGDERVFSGDRADDTAYGTAVVRIPEDRRIGQVQKPFALKFWRYTLYRGRTNPKKHFVLKNCKVMTKSSWLNGISRSGGREALVFVHGFNVSFVDSIFRCAQIAWDIRYPGIPIVFSWASRGRVLDYGYDRNSALLARDGFVALLEDLGKAGVETIHVLAHSMGNFAMLDALANHDHSARPLHLGEILMAAPDVDFDQYRSIASRVQAAAKGMTLYASANDKALKLSKKLAGDVPRAGDVPSNGPVLVDRIDSIDVSAVGDEVFGLNHGVFASEKSILNDVKLLLSQRIRPPSDRLAEIVGMPEGATQAQWWRYVN